MPDRMDGIHLQAIGRQRARLVETQDGDVAQRLDGVALLHERAVFDDAHRAQRIGQRDREEQAVGHQPDDERGAGDGLARIGARDQRVDDEQKLDVDHDRQHDAHDEVDFVLQRRQHAAKGARPGGDLIGQTLLADFFGHVERAAVDAETAGIDVIARLLGNEIGFARQLRFVHLHLPVADDAAVEHDLIARR